MTASRRALLLAGAATVAATAAAAAAEEPPVADGETLEFTSPYNYVRVERRGGVVTFRYAVNGARMSAVDLADPPRQLVEYVAHLFAADLAPPRPPRRALMAGLGAGGYHRLFNLLHPAARLVTVEIDPMIERLAAAHAGFRPGPNDAVAIDDARLFLRKAAAGAEAYDRVLLDAFDRRAQIPVHLATREFFALARARLDPADGLLLTNLHQGTRFFASQVLTLRAVFPEVVLLPVAGGGNVIAVAAPAGPPAAPPLLARLRGGLPADPAALAPYARNGVDLPAIARRAVPEPAWRPVLEPHGLVLTDDYAPAESLDREPAPVVGTG